jgi:hypothetical protein
MVLWGISQLGVLGERSHSVLRRAPNLPTTSGAIGGVKCLLNIEKDVKPSAFTPDT